MSHTKNYGIRSSIVVLSSEQKLPRVHSGAGFYAAFIQASKQNESESANVEISGTGRLRLRLADPHDEGINILIVIKKA